MNLFVAFRPEFLDFQRGIRVGNLADHERITRILKFALEYKFGEPFITERYGRGRYWQWIAWLPRANRLAKPISSDVSFGCAKFFIELDTEEQLFKSGLQVERGYLRPPADRRKWQLQQDWDWHRLLASLRPNSRLVQELRRLLREGFHIHAGTWEAPVRFTRPDQFSIRALAEALRRASPHHWAGFQLYYPMTEDEVRCSTGADLVEAILSTFDEVTAAMNACMQIELRPRPNAPIQIQPSPGSLPVPESAQSHRKTPSRSRTASSTSPTT